MLVKNPTHLQKIPSLTKNNVEKLAKAARAIEKYYGYPVDIEFVVQAPTIYLIQARPITEKVIEPSYIKDEYVAQLLPEDVDDLFVIGAGGGAVQTVEGKNNLIIADTLRAALKTFLDDTPNKDAIRAVIVRELAPATSHEATTFRGVGKPVFYLSDFKKIQQWISAQEFPLLLDPQRGIVVRFKKHGGLESIDDVIQKNAWLEHPIAKKESLFKLFVTHPELAFLKEYMKEHFPGVPTSKIITHIREGKDETIILQSLGTLVVRVAKLIKDEEVRQAQLKAAKKHTNPQLLEELRTVFSFLAQSLQEINDAMSVWLASAKTSQDRIAWLYPITFLDAVIKQVPMPQVFVNNYSLTSLLKIEKEEQQIVEEQQLGGQGLRILQVQLTKLKTDALTENVAREWQTYVSALQPTDKLSEGKIGKVALIVCNVKQLGIAPLWLNLSFAQAQQQFPDNVAQQTEALIEEYDKSKELLNKMRDIQQQLKEFPVAQFENPELFEKTWQSFGTILEYSKQRSFPGIFEGAPKLAQTAMLATMNNLVNTFDTSIKSLTGSTQYTDVLLKVARFKQMLEQYFDLLWTWATMDSIRKEMNELGPEGLDSVVAYLNRCRNLFYSVPVALDRLQASSKFNVSAVMLGSMADWDRSVGDRDTVTFEDTFTLIHQNLLLTISVLNQKAGLDKLPLPEIPAHLDAFLRRLSYRDREGVMHANFIGVRFEEDRVVYDYNFPLRFHSCTFAVTYNLKNRQTTFEMRLLGDARSRWPVIFCTVNLFVFFKEINFYQQPILDSDKGLLIFSFVIENEKHVALVEKLVPSLIEMTFITGVNFDRSIGEVERISGKDGMALLRELGDNYVKLLPQNSWLLGLFDLLNNKKLLPEKDISQIRQIILNSLASYDETTRDQGVSVLFHGDFAKKDILSWLSRNYASAPLKLREELYRRILYLGSPDPRPWLQEIVNAGLIEDLILVAREQWPASQRVLKALIENGYAIAEAVAVFDASAGVTDKLAKHARSSLLSVIMKSEKGMSELLKQGQAKNIVAEIREQLDSSSPSFGFILSALSNDQIRQQVTKEDGLASKLARRAGRGRSKNIPRLFEEMLKQPELAEEIDYTAIGPASDYVKSKKPDEQEVGLALFKQLFKNGYGFEDAVRLVNFSLQRSELEAKGRQLVNELLPYEKGRTALANEAVQLVMNEKTSAVGIDLFYHLISEGFGIQEGIDAAKKLVNDPSKEKQKVGRELFEALVLHKFAFTEAMDAYVEAINKLYAANDKDFKKIMTNVLSIRKIVGSEKKFSAIKEAGMLPRVKDALNKAKTLLGPKDAARAEAVLKIIETKEQQLKP